MLAEAVSCLEIVIRDSAKTKVAYWAKKLKEKLTKHDGPYQEYLDSIESINLDLCYHNPTTKIIEYKNDNGVDKFQFTAENQKKKRELVKELHNKMIDIELLSDKQGNLFLLDPSKDEFSKINELDPYIREKLEGILFKGSEENSEG